MKLRLLDNTLRFRLSRPEINQLIAGETVEAITAFASDTALRYSIKPTELTDVLEASYQANSIRVELPLSEARQFADEQTVTIQGTCCNNTVMVKIEKDFQCLAPRDEDESQLFAHPQAPDE